ncbi:MAG: S9 family peptidase [Phycisphaerales bacterium]|nr:S9 family peptidase [Phycisphaerales bacterium]
MLLLHEVPGHLLRRLRPRAASFARSALARPVVLLVALAIAARSGAAGDRAVVAVDLLRLQSVASIDVSRDGQVAVYAVRSIAPAEWRGDDVEYAPVSHLWLVNLQAERPVPVQLTYGEQTDSDPVLSPDGRRVAFVRKRPGGDAQAHVLSLAGGEAMPLAVVPGGVTDPQWSPDGSTIMVSAGVAIGELPGTPSWSSERPGRDWNDEPFSGTASAPKSKEPSPAGDPERVRAWLARNAAQGDPIVVTRLAFQSERDVRRGWRFQQIFLLSASDSSAPPRRVTSGFRDHKTPQFMPDGRRIIFAAADPGTMHPDREEASGIWSVAIDGADERELLQLPGWQLTRPRPSRDGSVVAFLGKQLDDPAYRQTVIGLVGPSGGEPIWLTESLDRSVRQFEWMGATPKLLLTAPDAGGVPLFMASPGLLEASKIVSESGGSPIGVLAFGTSGAVTVYAQCSVEQPCTLRMRDNRGDREIADLNPWVADRRLSRPVRGEVKRPDGTIVEYWVMEPSNRKPGQRTPLLLEIHGGPSGMWGPGEASMWHEFQMFCSAGWGIVYANPRGSGGYGYAFQRGSRQDWGAGPAGDVLAAVDEALRLDWVDSDRLAVTGGSYGGFLTAWLITRDHRFKAAVAQRGVYDLDTFFGEGNAWRLVERSFGGLPFDSRLRDLLDRNSPFLDARRIQTPLLILHGLQDMRTGVSQAFMLYRALKVLNKPVELVLYPDADHDLSRDGNPKDRIDRLLRISEFIGRWVK